MSKFIVWRRTGPREFNVSKYTAWEQVIEAVKKLVPEVVLTKEWLGYITNDVFITKELEKGK